MTEIEYRCIELIARVVEKTTHTSVAKHIAKLIASKITLKEEKPQQQQHKRSSSQGSSQPDRHQNKGYGKHDRSSSLGRKQLTEEFCRRYNAGVCPNAAASCAKADGTKLVHACCEFVNGKPCGKDHPKIKH